jgi:hypothetical protein
MSSHLGDDHLRRGAADTGNLIESGHRIGERGDLGIDPLLHGGDVGGDAVDPVEHLGQQKRVVVGEPAGQRLGQADGLGAQAAPGQVGQHRRVAFAGDEDGRDRPAGDPEQIAGHDRQLDQCVFEELLHPLLLRGAGLDQVHPVAGQVPEGPGPRQSRDAGRRPALMRI